MTYMAPAEGESDIVPDPQPGLSARVGVSLAWLGIIWAGFGAWPTWSSWPPMAALAPALVTLGVLGLAVTWLVATPRLPRVQVVSLVAALAAVGIGQGGAIHGRTFYATDSAALDDLASNLAAHGHNPYVAHLGGAMWTLLNGAPDFFTYTLVGGHITKVSYPAGSFLFQVPLDWLGVHHMATDWMDLIAGLLSAVVLYWMLPTSVRWLSPALLLLGGYLGIFANGGTDAVMLPFLLLAVWRWDRFVDPSNRWERYRPALALGVACSIKQTPWFFGVFLLLGMILEARGRGRSPWPIAGRYLGLAALPFVVLNLPFFIANPSAWFGGVTLPLTAPLVPDGQGVVSLALHGFTRGARLWPLSMAALLVVLGILVLLALSYGRLKRTWLFLLPLAFLVAPRSFAEYVLDLIPVAIVAAVSVRPAPAGASLNLPVLWRRSLMATPFVLAVICAGWSLRTPPLHIEVGQSLVSAGSPPVYRGLVVTVTNSTATTLKPYFMVLENGTHPTGFWRSWGNAPVVVAPHATKKVVLIPTWPTLTSEPGQYWVVAAYTDAPKAVSTSAPQRWNLKGA